MQTNPGGPVNPGANCPPTTATGNVALAFGASIASDAAPGAAPSAATVPVRAPRIFVTLRGIDALPASMPGADATTAWQPLAPQLAERPVQVDLNARTGDFCASKPVSVADSPAGVYSQLRLRIVPNLDPNATASRAPDRSTFSAALLAESACGANLLNCLIPPDAAAQPLAFDDSAEVLITSNRIAGGSIRVLPDTTTHLAISLDPRSSVALPTATALRLTPSFSVSNASCAAPE